MIKPTPNPPDTDPVSPYESDSKKLNEAAERALDFHFPSNADIKATARRRGLLGGMTDVGLCSGSFLGPLRGPAGASSLATECSMVLVNRNRQGRP